MQKHVALAIAKVVIATGLYNAIDVNSFDFRIAVQKIGYILHRVGCDIGLKFSWYTLGPYSRALQNYYSTVVNLLDRADNVDRNLEIKLGNDLEACVDRVIKFLNEFKQYMGGIDIKALEVLASLIMLCKDIYPEPDNPVEELIKRKKGISKDLIEKVWGFLIDRSICT